jgi:tetratricopeptide (TPR) repeat protein
MKKIDPKTKDLPAPREISEKLFERFFLPWTAILILVHLLTVYVAPQYMWGVHFYHFFPAGIGWILSLVTLTILIPGVGEFLYEKFAAFAEKIKKPFERLNPNITFLLFSLFSLPIFWIFRNRLHLLGDGYFRIRDLPQGNLHLQEWLDGFIHLAVFRIMSKLIPNWTPELTYAIISILCGGVFVFISLKLSSFLGKNGFQKVLIFFFLITLGSIQLFFGYVESYTILQVVLLAYIWFSFRYFAGKTNMYPALLTLVMSIGLHITSLIYLPSFVYLLTKGRTRLMPSGMDEASSLGKQKGRVRKEGDWKKPISTYLIVAALIIAAFLIAAWVYIAATRLEKTGKGIFLVPLMGTENYPFGIFSLGHISEFVNQLLLLSPLGISLMLFFLFYTIKYKSYRSGGKFEDRMINFLFLASLLALVYLFVFNFTLGSADWDLRCSPAPFFGLLGVLLFIRWGEKRSTVSSPSTSLRTSPQSTADQPVIPEERRLRSWGMNHTVYAWGVVFICFGLFHTVPWVLINANNNKSVARYTLIQEHDPHPVDETNYNLYKIARILNWAGMPSEMGKLYRRATERNPYDTLSYYNLAAYYHKKNDYDSALIIADTLLKIDSTYPKGNWLVGNVYLKKGKYSQALPYLERAFPYLADNMDYLYDLGMTNYWTNRFKEARACGAQMVKLDPSFPGGYHLMGLAYVQLGEFDNAINAWEQILAINPNDSTATINIKMLQEYLKRMGE